MVKLFIVVVALLSLAEALVDLVGSAIDAAQGTPYRWRLTGAVVKAALFVEAIWLLAHGAHL